MKRLTKLIKCLLPVILFFSLLLTAQVVWAQTGTVNASILNFREGPSIISRRIGRIPNGTVVNIVDTSNKNWFKITYDGKIGYVSSDYIILNSTDAYGTGTVNATALHVRQGPSLSATILTKLYTNQKVNILSKEGNWYKILLNGKECYVYAQYINLDTKSTGSNIGKVYEVICNRLNMRAGASIESERIGSLTRGSKVTLLDVKGEWFYIENSSGKKAYVHSDYLKLYTKTTTRGEENVIDPPAPVNASEADALIEYAKSFLGVKYVYGGSTPSGFDCSGFTQYVFKKFGYKINRVSRDQAKNGVAVSKSQLQKGDLVFFASSRGSNTIGHVGIYIGGGSFIHSSSGKNNMKVCITSLSEPFYVDTYITARRILK